MGEFKGPIVEGAYYERKDGSVVGPARCKWTNMFELSQYYYTLNGYSTAAPREPQWDLTRRVYITHTDPAEVVAELRVQATVLDWFTPEEIHEATGWRDAADLVADRLGVK